MNNLIIGKYYYFESYNIKVPNIAKLNNIKDNCFDSENWIMLRHSLCKNGGGCWNFNCISSIREATPFELQQYLPKYHPDLISEFKKGDYIVTLKVKDSGLYYCAKDNFCFKIRETHTGIYPEIDLKGSTTNGHNVMSFDKRELLQDWRYATEQEIDFYDREGCPYDTTQLVSGFILPEKWYIKLTNENKEILGAWRTKGYLGVLRNKNPAGYLLSELYGDKGYWVNSLKNYNNFIEITFEQFKKYVLNKKDTEKTYLEKPLIPEDCYNPELLRIEPNLYEPNQTIYF